MSGEFSNSNREEENNFNNGWGGEYPEFRGYNESPKSLSDFDPAELAIQLGAHPASDGSFVCSRESLNQFCADNGFDRNEVKSFIASALTEQSEATAESPKSLSDFDPAELAKQLGAHSASDGSFVCSRESLNQFCADYGFDRNEVKSFIASALTEQSRATESATSEGMHAVYDSALGQNRAGAERMSGKDERLEDLMQRYNELAANYDSMKDHGEIRDVLAKVMSATLGESYSALYREHPKPGFGQNRALKKLVKEANDTVINLFGADLRTMCNFMSQLDVEATERQNFNDSLDNNSYQKTGVHSIADSYVEQYGGNVEAARDAYVNDPSRQGELSKMHSSYYGNYAGYYGLNFLKQK